LKGILALSATGASFGGYAMAEPFRLRVTRYAFTPRAWPCGLRLKLAVIADLHIIEPFMGVSRVAQIVARTNALAPDAVLLLGDYEPGFGMRKWARRVGGSVVDRDDWTRELGRLKAPLGVHGVLGNHDWWEDAMAQDRRCGPTATGLALERAGIRMHENSAVRVIHQGEPIWICGLGDQWAFHKYRPERGTRFQFVGTDDLAGMLGQVSDDAPVVMMAHEPDVFAEMGGLADRVSLTVSGHTHGGQISLMGYTPVVPSRYGARYAYGHIIESERHLVVSGGLGCSGLPLRFGAPPEVVLIELGGDTA
jgi:uncharacterized protein